MRFKKNKRHDLRKEPQAIDNKQQNAMDESSNIKSSLERLEHRIQTRGIPKRAKKVGEWGGADVVIKKELDEDTKNWLGDDVIVISSQNTEPRRRAVITEYSRELSWLFHRLKRIFSGRIDYISKYDFYGTLAQSAIDYLENNKENKDAKALLLAVLNTSKQFVQNL